MAVMLLRRGESRYIQFTDAKGRRRTVSLGPVADKTARNVTFHVGKLVEAVANNDTPPRATAEWVEGVGVKLHAKLCQVGLVAPRQEKSPVELAAFVDGYIEGRTDLKRMTVNILKQTRRLLVAFFGDHRDLTTVNRGEAKDWFRGMGRTHSPATVAAYVKRARQFFADAADRRLIEDNPFEGIKTGSQTNDERRRFVPAADVLKLMDEATDAEWRVVYALARWGGLRTPSETSRLRWIDVDFEKGRMIVRPTKTERYAGKDKRVVPIFPELLPWLREAFDQAAEGAEYVVARHRGENLRTATLRFIERAGLTPWPKLFQNMRSTRQTELEDVFPTHVVCDWLGNSPKVARKHYLQTTDQHFDRARCYGAAPTPATEAPVAHQNGEKPRKNGGDDDTDCPGWESNFHAFSRGIKGVKGRALRNALRRLKRASESIYQAQTAPLRTRPPARRQRGGRHG